MSEQSIYAKVAEYRTIQQAIADVNEIWDKAEAEVNLIRPTNLCRFQCHHLVECKQ